MEFKSGQTFKAIPGGGIIIKKIHIDHVLPSIYNDQKLIIYRTWSINKQIWQEYLCTDYQMEMYINFAKEK